MLNINSELFSSSYTKTDVIIFHFEMHKNDFEYYVDIVNFHEKKKKMNFNYASTSIKTT